MNEGEAQTAKSKNGYFWLECQRGKAITR